jgi:hypothetical protein
LCHCGALVLSFSSVCARLCLRVRPPPPPASGGFLSSPESRFRIKYEVFVESSWLGRAWAVRVLAAPKETSCDGCAPFWVSGTWARRGFAPITQFGCHVFSPALCQSISMCSRTIGAEGVSFVSERLGFLGPSARPRSQLLNDRVGLSELKIRDSWGRV